MFKRSILYIGIFAAVLFSPVLGHCQDVPDRKALAEVIEVLCPNDKGLLNEVLLAATNPKEYLAKFSDDLLERGIETWEEVDYWIALIDGLQRRKCLIEVDWKNSGEGFGWQLRQLKVSDTNKLDWSLLEKQGEDYKPTVRFAPEVESILLPRNLSLVFLVFSGDSYALSIVPRKDISRIRSAAHKLSHKIEVFDKDAGDK